MFGHKSFLRLGPLEDSSIVGLYKESYELERCTYSFSQGVNTDGKAQTNVRGGAINLTIPGIPPEDVINWALQSRKYYDGTIVICDDNDMPLEKIQFENAACIGMEIDYTRDGKAYIVTKLHLQVKKLTVGSTSLNNHWVGFD